MAAPPRRNNHRRPVSDPHTIGDCFANSVEIEDHEDWVRLTWLADHGGDGHGSRRKVAAIVVPRSAVPAVTQELRGSHAHTRENRRH